MCRRSTPQKTIDERAFPVRVKVLVPELGMGSQSELIFTWLDGQVGRANYANHSGGRNARGQVTHYYFRDTVTADQFVRWITGLGLELADGTTAITYRSAALPFARGTP